MQKDRRFDNGDYLTGWDMYLMGWGSHLMPRESLGPGVPP